VSFKNETKSKLLNMPQSMLHPLPLVEKDKTRPTQVAHDSLTNEIGPTMAEINISTGGASPSCGRTEAALKEEGEQAGATAGRPYRKSPVPAAGLTTCGRRELGLTGGRTTGPDGLT